MGRLDDVAASGTDLLLVVEGYGLVAAVPILAFSVLLLLQGHRRLPITAFSIGAVAGYLLAPTLLDLLVAAGIAVPLTMAQAQVAIALLIGMIMVSVAQMSLRLAAGLLAFSAITAAVEALYVRGIDIEQGEFIPLVAALATWFFTRSVRRSLPVLAASLIGALGLLVGVHIAMGMPVLSLHPGMSTSIWFAVPITGVSLVYQQRAAKKRRARNEMDALMRDSSMKNLTEAERRERAIAIQTNLKGRGRGSTSVRRRVDPLEQYLTPHGRALLDREALESSRAYKRELRKAERTVEKAERRAERAAQKANDNAGTKGASVEADSSDAEDGDGA